MPSILFICTANICRSPMAMALFRKKVEQEPDAADWRIDSAGTWGLTGEPAAVKSVVVMQQYGIDLREHRSQEVSLAVLKSYDLILTMEQGHKEALRAEYPVLRDRIYLLSEMVDKNYDIQDPFGEPLSEYQETAQELDQLLTAGYSKICALARKNTMVKT
ncbi:MAG: low molecular weight protein arginine phosphatase [Omnitrophica WOR_2 bacterium]